MKSTVVLINPPLSLEDRYGKEMKRFGAVSEPLGIAYIAGFLEARGVPVRIIDAQADRIGIAQIVEDVARRRDTLVGISVLTPAFAVVRELAKRIKAAAPECKIVLGGPHCTVLPERTLAEIEAADFICIGEGEETAAEIALLDDFSEPDAVAGICFRRNGTILRSPPRPYIRDLDRIPPPARHLLPMRKYHLTASRMSGTDYCPTIIVARGCPFSCTYCSRTFGRTFRAHSTQRILAEIDALIEKYGVGQINIEADTLTVNKRFVRALCTAMIDSGLHKKIRWTCESRVDTVDAEMLALMRSAGCWQISYGVETGSRRLLQLIQKSVSLEQIRETFRLTHEAGITTRGFFMLGLPTESRRESMATIGLARELNPLWAQFTITVPYPGTKMFEDLDRTGQIRTYDWSKYNTWSGWKGEKEIPFVPEGRRIEELVELQKRALRLFYLRPSVAVRFLRNTRSLYDFHKYLTGFWVLLKSRLQSPSTEDRKR